MSMAKRISQRRSELKLSQKQAALLSGISQQAWSKLENDKVCDSRNIVAIAKALNVTSEWLKFGGAKTKEAVIGTRVPLINFVQAGSFHEVELSGEYDYLLTLENISSSSFALTIHDDSMSPEFAPGDTIIVDPCIDPKPGDYVVASNGRKETTFKRYKYRGTDSEGKPMFDLVSVNTDYPTYNSELIPIKIIGIMVEHRRYRRKK